LPRLWDILNGALQRAPGSTVNSHGVTPAEQKRGPLEHADEDRTPEQSGVLTREELRELTEGILESFREAPTRPLKKLPR
jgi:hypothetical protein